MYVTKRKEERIKMSYKKYLEYLITTSLTHHDEYIRKVYDPRINNICICKDHRIANLRFLKNLRRKNRIQSVKYTIECQQRKFSKKVGKKY